MNEVNTIVFAKKNFQEDEFNKKITTQLQLLMDTHNICTVYQNKTDDDTFVIIEYTSDDPYLNQPYPYFLYLDEAEYVSLYIVKKSIFQYENEIEALTESIEQSELAIKQAMTDKKKTGNNLN